MENSNLQLFLVAQSILEFHGNRQMDQIDRTDMVTNVRVLYIQRCTEYKEQACNK
jgi:hypothetical protein